MNANHFLPLAFKDVNVILNGKTVLNNINVSINNDGISVIIGSNGSGKTMLLKCCANLILPSSGGIRWQQIPTPPQLTFVPQQPVLLDRSARDNIRLPLEHNKIENADQRCDAALAWANIGPLSQQPALTLSTGEQQLVALARAWAISPQLLLLDEPTANLDPARCQDINNLIQEMSQSCEIIMTTHSLKQAKELASNIILIERGKIVSNLENEAFLTQASTKNLS
jgi:tungstate transport system ATP-binding protein